MTDRSSVPDHLWGEIAVVLTVEGVSKSFGRRKVLDDVRFSVEAGRSLAVVGPSGSGKTTLLAILGLLDRPTCGHLSIGGTRIEYGRHEHAVRRDRIGFVFQDFNLVPHVSVVANLELALDRGGVERAVAMLHELGMGDLVHARPTRLSAGEQQRVAIVRALAKRPSLVLADEPTASLDPDTRDQVLDALRGAQDGGAAVVVVTHDATVARWADTVLRLDARTGALVPGEAP